MICPRRTGGNRVPRRVAYLLRAPDLEVVGIRGNVDSRVARVTSGELDAVVLAMAGLNRLGLRPQGSPWVSTSCCPRSGRAHWEWRCCATTRGRRRRRDQSRHHGGSGLGQNVPLLAGLGAGCSAPVGALAEIAGDTLELRAAVLSHDGSQMYMHDDRFAAGSRRGTARRRRPDRTRRRSTIGENR